MYHLVIVGDSEPMVFALDLMPVQLARKCGDARFWSVAPWREEVVFDSQILLGCNNIPQAEMGKYFIDRLVFVPCVFLLEFLDVLRVNVHENGFNRHQVDHLLEGVLLPLDLLFRLELE